MSKRFFWSLILLCLGAYSLSAEAFYRSVIFATGTSLPECSLYAKQMGEKFQKDPKMRRLQKEKGFSVLSRPSGRYYVAAVEPLYDDNTTLVVLDFVKKSFPDAFVYHHKGAYKPVKPAFYTIKSAPHVQSAPAAKPHDKPVRPARHAAQKSEESSVLVYLLGFVALLLLIGFLRHRIKSESMRRHLEEKHENVEDLLVDVGKQIHTPAQEIIQSSEKILQTPLTPDQAKEIEKIRHSDIRVLGVATELIEYMRIKADEITLRKECFYLDNVLDEVAGNVAHAFEGEGVRLIYEIDKEVPSRLKGDPDNLGKIIRKLIESAIRRSGEGDIYLGVHLDGTAKKPIISYTVVDAAPPLSQENLDGIFEPFAATEERHGSGLSLYIAQSLAKKMGGWVEAKNDGAGGNRFTAVLPFEPVDEDRRFYPLPAKAYTGRSVLIVDPHTPSAEAMEKMFGYFKSRVEINPDIDLQEADAWKGYDMVVIAPEALCAETRDALRRERGRAKAKLVLAVDMLMPHPDAQTLRPLFDAQIAKPLDRQRVYDLLVDLFKEEIPPERKTARTQTQPTTEGAVYPDVEEAEGITKESFAIFSGASLLVVEDNKINQKVLLSLLGSSGIRIVVAEDGKEALEKLESEGPFDLVLMDINMPVMDGYEATRRIRKQEKYADLPVVSLTGLGLPEEIAKMYAIGMNSHLLKPLKIGQLYTIFKRFLPHSETEIRPSKTSQEPLPNDAVDFRRGIALANGDRALYTEVLSEFTHLYENLPESRLNPSDPRELYRTAIDLKGVASNLGAFLLTDAADRVVANIRNGKAVPQEDLQNLKTALEETLRAIKMFLKKERGA
ncbi:MAG: response regulator [Epsilonproteobacteria bacterium]|nr:response regulator [Campylobacterota bacterium]